MRAKVSRFINGLTLAGLGGVLLAFYFSGRIDQYLHPQFRVLALVGGAAFCIGSVVYMLAKSSAQCCVDGECVHQNSDSPVRSVAAFGVLLVPLVTGAALSKDGYDQQLVLNRGFVQDVTKLPVPSARQPASQNPPIPPAALGADIDATASAEPPLPQESPTPAPSPPTQSVKGPAADPNAPSTDPNAPSTDPNAPSTEGSDQYLPKAADGNIALEVTDLLYGEAEESLRKMFTGKTVEVIGQYLPGKNGAEFKLVRMFIVCCAADARPLAVPVNTDQPYKGTDMAWVRVVGKPVYALQEGGRAKVTLKADSIVPIDPPADAMLY
jgi:uncharacterized repeat protein (TIGR03943 family)